MKILNRSAVSGWTHIRYIASPSPSPKDLHSYYNFFEITTQGWIPILRRWWWIYWKRWRQPTTRLSYALYINLPRLSSLNLISWWYVFYLLYIFSRNWFLDSLQTVISATRKIDICRTCLRGNRIFRCQRPHLPFFLQPRRLLPYVLYIFSFCFPRIS